MALVSDPSGDTSATTSSSPTIASDKADYAPGELVTLTGSGWQVGESVNIKVNDTYGASWSRNVDVTADASGNITDSFNLPNAFVSDYDVTATGAQSGVATTSFTDGNLVFTTGTSGPAPGSWTVNYKLHSGTNPTPYTTCNDPNPTDQSKTVLPGGTTGQQSQTQGINANSSVLLGTVTDNSSTLEFKKWTSDAAGANPVSANTCVTGTSGNGTIGT